MQVSDSWSEEKIVGGFKTGQSAAELWVKENALCGKRRSYPYPYRHTWSQHLRSTWASQRCRGIVSAEHHQQIFITFQLSSSPDSQSANFNYPFSAPGLFFAVSSSNGKSSGPHGIGYPMIQNRPLSAKIRFLYVKGKLKANSCNW